jgi:phage gp46-like protein
LAATDGFDTAIKMSLMCERRADSSEISTSQYRRGWFGNLILDYDNFEIGSKLWLLSQARADQLNLNLAKTYTQAAFQWMVDDNLIKKLDVFTRYDRNFKLIITIIFYRSNDKTESIAYNLWDNTFLEN